MNIQCDIRTRENSMTEKILTCKPTRAEIRVKKGTRCAGECNEKRDVLSKKRGG